MAFWEQYKKKHNLGNDYTILAPIRHKNMFLLYGEKNLMKNSEKYIPHIMYLWKKDKLYKYPKIHVMAYPKGHSKRINNIEENLRAGIGIMMDDCYRFGCFDLTYDSDEPIIVPPILDTQYELHTENNILLIPYTNSRINISLAIWEEIASELKKAGYTVYTNIGTTKEKAVKGTIPLQISITELPAILRKYDFISLCGRCGLADWLFVNECKQIILHSCKKNPKNRNEWLCTCVEKKDSFKVMKRKCLLNEENAEDVWLYTDDLSSDYIESIMQKIQKIET
ncbi:MAG: hypothetical protein IK024_12945 [Treponema sp.]|nr:hypothetical protein [Treponema sp.]